MPGSTKSPPAATEKPVDDYHGIVWVASYPKSGNTWTRNFLHNLFGILEGRETDEQDINRMSEFTTWDLSAKIYEKHLGKPPLEAGNAAVAAVRPLVQKEIADRTDGLALIKTHHALVTDHGVPTINFGVTSGAIYIVRNPLDIAVSFASHMGADIDTAIEHMATEGLETPITSKSVHEVYGTWSEHVLSWTAKPRKAFYIMRYEEMLEDPRRTFGALAHHLLLTPTSAQLGEAIERSSFERLQKQEAEHGFREKPKRAERFFREGKAGGWRKNLSRRQVRRIVSAHHEQMRRFGYISEDIEHLAPPPA